MKSKNFSRALLVAIAVSAASAAMAAPSIENQPTAVAPTKKHEKARRPTLTQIIEGKVMSVVGIVQGAIADAQAQEVRAKMAMAAKARAAMEAKARAAMEAKAAIAKRNALASDAQAPCPNDPDNSRSVTDAPSSLDKGRCR
jgi:hypothetical protein